jgi:dipeptidyl aminopeptidase/acylaminoacyl peptidase
MRWFCLLLLVACSRPPAPAATRESFVEARRSFRTQLHERPRSRGGPPAAPPGKMFERVKYPAPGGPLWAYLTPDPGDGKKRPAVVWVHGGFDYSIDGWVFERGERANDQSAAGFREAGLVLLLPSFRGANDNPGRSELLYGEVDDLLAAVAFARSLPYVDGVYLGGHSTGGTLALLAAAAGAEVKAVLSLGPIDWIEDYGVSPPFAAGDAREWRMRSPLPWMADIRVPTLIVEGEGGNTSAARALGRGHRAVRVKIVPGHDHFTVIAPVVDALARKLLAGEDPLDLQDHEIR